MAEDFRSSVGILGGTSLINSMIYTRGSVADYDIWSTTGDGHPDWSYRKVLPYFRKGERALNKAGTEYRGDSGNMGWSSGISVLS